MNATEFFKDIAKRNYMEFMTCPNDRTLLWNAIVSMNTVAEYVALARLGYAQVSRDTLGREAKKVRDAFPSLSDLKHCAETFKHVRKIKDHPKLGSPFTTIATATGVSVDDLTTWKIGTHDLVDVLRRAFTTLASFPELK
jgi:hypothetical protein